MSARINTVNPKANANPATLASAARYQPGARSFTGRAISSPPSLWVRFRMDDRGHGRSLCHAREEVYERLDLGRAERVREIVRHHPGAVPAGQVLVGVGDRRVDALTERLAPHGHRFSARAVALQALIEVRTTGAAGP